MLFRVPVLGGLQDHILMILDLFSGPFLETILVTFGAPFLHNFSEGLQEAQKISSSPRVGGDLVGIWGPVTGLHQQDKQIYRWKSADL